MKAFIGINVDIEGASPKKATIQANYYEAIARSDGTPVLIPPGSDKYVADLLGQIDAVLFIGGSDYSPTFYDEQTQATVELAHADRMDFDYRLLQHTLACPNLPVLGICAGCQIINIGLGGNLHQDIATDFPDSTVEHTSSNGWRSGFKNHAVNLQAESRLAKIYGQTRLAVPTSHHQCVKKLGIGLAATAHADDGIIEAVEMNERPFVIGVQWHPERDYAGNKALFDAFVRAAIANRQVNKP